MLRTALGAGRIERVARGVYTFIGVPRTSRFELSLAIAQGGRFATVAVRAAAAAHNLPGGVPQLIEISVPRWHRPLPRGWIVHESMDLTPQDRTVIDGLPVTTVTRTLIDLGTRVPERVVDAAISEAVRRGMTTLEELAIRRDELSRRGRNGVGVMRTLLADRTDPGERAESALEVAAWTMLRRSGFPMPTLQHWVRDGPFAARLDGAYVPLRVGIEVDSYRHHLHPAGLDGDADRNNQLVAMGWQLLHWTAQHINREPEKTMANLERLCRKRSRELGVPFNP